MMASNWPLVTVSPSLTSNCLQAPGNFRADNDLVGGDDAGQRNGGGMAQAGPHDQNCDNGQGGNENPNAFFHGSGDGSLNTAWRRNSSTSCLRRLRLVSAYGPAGPSFWMTGAAEK